MKRKGLKLLIFVGVLLCFTVACEKVDKAKRNYRLCRQRIIEFSTTIDPKSESYSEELKQKVLEFCGIYGFQDIDEFRDAHKKYGNPSDETLMKIFQEIALEVSPLDTTAAIPTIPAERKAERATIRAISLKVLQKKLKEHHGKGAFPGDLSRLGGITGILGYMVDNANRDIILIGKVESRLPALYLEDFVVALRNAWLKYSQVKENTYYYSDPGCTIDPDPNVLLKLDDIGRQIMNSSQDSEVEENIKQWEQICSSPQEVGVFGVPFHSRFAWVMVKADYDMKKLADGSDSLDIPGFSSLIDMELEIARKSILEAKPIAIPLSSMNRFWFHPGENTYLENENERMVLIDKCNVILLTEEEYLTRSGKVVGTGQANPYAREFTGKFSTYYSQIAEKRPIYHDLENLFRFVALAKILELKSPHKGIGLNIDYLLNQYPVSTVVVKEQLPGRSNVKRFEHKRDIQTGAYIRQLWIPSCGGVSIAIHPEPGDFLKDNSGITNNLKKNLLDARTSSDELYWDYVEETEKGPGISPVDFTSLIKEGFKIKPNSNYLKSISGI